MKLIMFHTFSDVQSVAAAGLRQPIDNREGKLLVGLRSITYTVGWHNVGDGEAFLYRAANSRTIRRIPVTSGLWSFSLLCDVLEGSSLGVSLKVKKASGRITLIIPDGWELQLTAGLRSLLGLNDAGWLNAGAYIGDRPVSFTTVKALHIHLDQVNSYYNTLDKAPSTLLTIVGVKCPSFGHIETVSFQHPEFKRLNRGTVHELKVSVHDDTGQLIDNHDLPISVVLEFSE